MELLDLGIVAVFLLFALAGWHNGFFLSMLNTAGYFVSWLVSLLVSPAVARMILGNADLSTAMLYYTEGAELVTDVELRRLAVHQLSSANMNEILTNADLPVPLDTLTARNMAGEVFKEQGISTVGDYFNQTIVNFTINVVAFLLVFFVVKLIITFILKAVDNTAGFPMLKHFDGPIGAGFGVVRGFFAVFVLFMVVPTLLVVLPFDSVGEYIGGSFFGRFFSQSNFLLSFISGVI